MNRSTACLHAGGGRPDNGGLVTPLYPATAYEYLDVERQVYPRYYNTPNQEVVVRTLCTLEGAEEGVVFSSGMAAVSSVMLALLDPGDHVVLLEGIYGGTHSFVTDEFERLGISWTFAPADGLAEAVTAATRLLYVESPTNPLLGIVDLAAVAEVAREHGVPTVIDNTFASPINQRPIEHGIDLVLHSGTKYLGGHSDLICGVVVGRSDLVQRVRRQATHLGGSLNAADCALLERSLKTLSVRVERQTANAMAIARFLDEHDAVRRVFYPGLPRHAKHDVAARQMEGFGAMMAFELADGDAVAFQHRLRYITPALSLGGVESTIVLPAATSHQKMAPDERERLGISDGLLRLSVGIEDVDDLLGDLNHALHG